MSALNEIRQSAYDLAFSEHSPLERTEALFGSLTDLLAEHDHFYNPQWANLKVKVGRNLAETHGFDVDEQMGILTLFYILDSHANQDLDSDWEEQVAGKSDVEKALKALSLLVQSAMSMDQAELGDQSITALDLWEHVTKRMETPSRIAFCILTTGRLTKDGWATAGHGGLFHTSAWDIERFKSLVEGQADAVEVDFAKYDGGIHCLLGGRFSSEEAVANENTQVYVGVLPGECLADIYFEHRTRLLQHNVRAFLTFSTGVNKGIRKTIREQPSRFLAYNNGVAATASSVEVTEVAPGVFRLLKASDFQIVNGGQTTAALLQTRLVEGPSSLEQVKVAMKLTVVTPESVAELVPYISKFANSQNKIQDSDFDSNAPWFGELEIISRRMEASGNEASGGQPIHWFFERMRGQYNVEIGRQATPARKLSFQAKNPKSSILSKIDLAVTLLAWNGRPDTSCQGGQKCFKEFIKLLKIPGESDPLPTEDNFKMICGLLIAFREGERLFREIGLKDMRSQAIKYALALLGKNTGLTLPFDEIWRLQRLPHDLREDLRTVIRTCHKILENLSGNKTEGAKKPGLWAALSEMVIHLKSDSISKWQKFQFSDVLSTTVREKAVEVLFKLPKEAWEQISKITWIDRVCQTAAGKLSKLSVKAKAQIKPEVAKSCANALLALDKKPEIGRRFREYFTEDEWLRINEMAKWTGV